MDFQGAGAAVSFHFGLVALKKQRPTRGVSSTQDCLYHSIGPPGPELVQADRDSCCRRQIATCAAPRPRFPPAIKKELTTRDLPLNSGTPVRDDHHMCRCKVRALRESPCTLLDAKIQGESKNQNKTYWVE